MCTFCVPYVPVKLRRRSLRAPLPGDPRGEEDEQGILSSVQKIHNIVDEEIKAGIDEKRIIVGGFSQGGALSYLVALTTERKVRDLIDISRNASSNALVS